MIIGRIEGWTHAFGKPEGMTDEQCATLHVRAQRQEDESVTLTSAWFPTPAELAALNAGEPVYLSVFGGGHPPVFVGVKGVTA